MSDGGISIISVLRIKQENEANKLNYLDAFLWITFLVRKCGKITNDHQRQQT